MVNQRIPERDLLKELANLYPAFTSVEDVELKPLANSSPPVIPRPKTKEVVESFLALRRHQRVKPGTLATEGKRLGQFERAMAIAGFDHLPTDPQPLLDYLGRFNGETGRHRRNQQDILGMLYRFAHRHYGLPNPMAGLPRPRVTTKPPRVLSLDQMRTLDEAPQTLQERCALDMLMGHGWRQVEARRIRAGDVRDVQDSVLWVRGKERDEWAPILPETLERLQELGLGLPSDGCIFQGQRGPLGEDGMSQLVDRLYARAGIEGFTGHDLRRTFATQVRLASGDEFLAMRLLRDKIPGVNDRYLVFPPSELVDALSQYSPLHRITMVETGEGRTPRPEDPLSQDMLQA